MRFSTSTFLALVVVLSSGGLVAAQARANTFGFESPTYSLGGLTGQDSWASANDDFVVDNVDSTEGSQSAFSTTGELSIVTRVLDTSFPVGSTIFMSMDVRGSNAWTTLKDASGTRLLEFGFANDHSSGLYHFCDICDEGPVDTGSVPDSDRWVTLWAKFFDGGAGDMRADIGWTELSGTPFVDGLVVANLEARDVPAQLLTLGSWNTGEGRFDNIRIIPEPSTLLLGSLAAVGLLMRRRSLVFKAIPEPY